MTSLMFGFTSSVWLMFSALYVFLVDRRVSSRKIVMTAIVIHILLIAFHFMLKPVNLAILAMIVEASLAYRVFVSDFPLRKTFVLLLSCSVCLSFAWGIDISYGCNVLCDGEEPSVYRVISAVLTILSGLCFVGSEHFAERRGSTYTDIFKFNGYHRRGDRP